MKTISIISSSIRPDLWSTLNTNLSQNKVSYELIFVGPYPNKNKLAPNIKYIKYFSKPAQCVARGLIEAEGDYLMIIADDVFFEDFYTLDKMYDLIKKNTNSIISCTYKIENKVKTELLKYDPHHSHSPQVPISPLFSKKLLHQFGSIDSEFVAIMYDLDLYLRFISNGVELIYLNSAVIAEDKNLSKGSTLNRDYWKIDRALLDKNWVSYTPDNKITFNKSRKFPVRNYDNYCLKNDICVKPRGRWKNKLFSIFVGKEIFNFFQSILLFRIDYFYFIKNKYNNNYLIKLLLTIYRKFK